MESCFAAFLDSAVRHQVADFPAPVWEKQSSGVEDDENLVVQVGAVSSGLASHFGSSFAVVPLPVGPGLVLALDH